MGVVLAFPPQDQLALWAEETYSGGASTCGRDELADFHAFRRLRCAIDTLEYARKYCSAGEIADAESELREAVERVFGERR